MREAYHGWTFASDAVLTSIADNPNALTTRPSWVHTVDAANPYRGVHRGPDAARYAPEAAQVIDDLAVAGTPPAGFICEPYFGNAGGVALPDGYLAQVYAAVRRHGGIAIADEVQVGYGRLGEWFWGFQQQQAVPDVVSRREVPWGRWATDRRRSSRRREIADRYRTGWVASLVHGRLAGVVRDRLLRCLTSSQEEGLQENARVVGAHLKAAPSRPSPTRTPIVGCRPRLRPLSGPRARARPRHSRARHRGDSRGSATACSSWASSCNPPATSRTCSRSSPRCVSHRSRSTTSPTPSNESSRPAGDVYASRHTLLWTELVRTHQRRPVTHVGGRPLVTLNGNSIDTCEPLPLLCGPRHMTSLSDIDVMSRSKDSRERHLTSDRARSPRHTQRPGQSAHPAGDGCRFRCRSGAVSAPPALHPAQNWMNDPNGLVYTTASTTSSSSTTRRAPAGATCRWGHATSPDLPALGGAPGRDRGHARSRRSTPARSWSTSGLLRPRRRRRPAAGRRLHQRLDARPPDALRHAVAVGRLQHRRRPDLDDVRRQPGPRPRVERLPRPQGLPVRRRRPAATG